MELMTEIWEYYQVNYKIVLELMKNHALITVYGIFFACLAAAPLVYIGVRHPKIHKVLLTLLNLFQTVPGLSLAALLIFVTGIGPGSVVVAVVIYSMLPLYKNTYTGIVSVDKSVVDASRGLGMSELQIWRYVLIPLAMYAVISGIKTSLIIGIGMAAIGSYIGAATLGDILIRGINATNGNAVILAGVIPLGIMALSIETIGNYLERKIKRN